MSMEDQRKLSAACEGKAVEGAGNYAGGIDGFIVFTQAKPDAGFEYSVDGVHYKLRDPVKIEEAKTVFCLDAAEQVEEGFCAFETVEGIGVAGVQLVDVSKSKGPTFPRISVQRKARLVDPSTGETVAEYVHKSAAPKCDQFVGDPVAENFRALEPSPISFADWTLEQLGVPK